MKYYKITSEVSDTFGNLGNAMLDKIPPQVMTKWNIRFGEVKIVCNAPPPNNAILTSSYIKSTPI